jgi:hypothetical protein
MSDSLSCPPTAATRITGRASGDPADAEFVEEAANLFFDVVADQSHASPV